MTYEIIYSSRSGNTKMLAQAIRETLLKEDCLYFGAPKDAPLTAERLYIGFWTDKGSCDEDTGILLGKLQNKEVFLFGTAGFGGEASYFQKILEKTTSFLQPGNTVIGTYMCQGKMPMSVRERYVKMQTEGKQIPGLEGMIENFDKALSHPDENDLELLKKRIQ